MRYALIVVMFCTLPLFIYLIKKGGKERTFLFILLGFLPIFAAPFHLEVSLLNWSTWPGHAKGVILSLADTLSFAICLYYGRNNRKPALRSIWIIFFASCIVGVFIGKLILPATFFLTEIFRAALYFRACYLIFSNGGLVPFSNGLAIAVITNAFFTLSNSFKGQVQAQGLLGHQNISGMATNLAIPLLLTVGLKDRVRPFLLIAVASGAMVAIGGGSRGVIIFYGASVFFTLLLISRIQPNPRKTVAFVTCILAIAVAAPVAQYKLAERFEKAGTQMNFEKDSERIAFEKAARLMIADHPFGVGLNQYIISANADGYSDRAGVSWYWASRAATVHNTYLLAQAEGGPFALIGFCILLWVPAIFSVAQSFRRQNPARILAVPCGVAMGVLTFHARVEWVTVTMVALYGMAYNMAITAAAIEIGRIRKKQAAAAAPSPVVEEPVSVPA